MEEYINKYDSFEKKIVYDFKLGDGGIGDCIKYFMFILSICIKHNIKLYYKKNNILIEKYLILKHKKMYINENDIKDSKNNMNVNNLENINVGVYNILSPHWGYNRYNYNMPLLPCNQVFYFSDTVRLNSKNLLSIDIKNYISIHLRLGDKYLETDKSFVYCKDDTRIYNQQKLFKFIENNSDKNIIFFCDNNNYKLNIKNKYNNVIITSCNIGHTSLSNTTEKQVLDAISEFYLMANSKKIYSASESGFSIIASKFNNIPNEII
jgi:hypothetical protein